MKTRWHSQQMHRALAKGFSKPKVIYDEPGRGSVVPHCCSWGPDSDSSREKDSWCGQAGSAAAGPPACVPGSTDPGLAQTGTPCSWLPPPWQLVALELPAGVGTCGLGGVWSSTCSAPTSAASSLCQRQHGANHTSTSWHQFRVLMEAK